MQSSLGLIALAYALLFALAIAQFRTVRRQAARFEVMERAFQDNASRLDTTLTHMDQGLMMIDSAGIIVVCNSRVRQLLGLPDDLPLAQRPFDDLVRHQWDTQEFVRADVGMHEFLQSGGIQRAPPIYERQRPDGTTIEIRTTPLEGGGYVRTYTDVTARSLAEAALREQATTDDLTGLANRLMFRRQLQAALAAHSSSGESFALLYMDLDRFKAVNDTHGHPVGDRLLVAIARRLGGQARASDTVARLGGDEFAMLIYGVDAAGAAALADRIIAAVSVSYAIDEAAVEIGLSVGIATSVVPGTSPDEMMRQADSALYEAKKAGQSTWRVHDGGAPAGPA